MCVGLVIRSRRLGIGPAGIRGQKISKYHKGHTIKEYMYSKIYIKIAKFELSFVSFVKDIFKYISPKPYLIVDF